MWLWLRLCFVQTARLGMGLLSTPSKEVGDMLLAWGNMHVARPPGCPCLLLLLLLLLPSLLLLLLLQLLQLLSTLLLEVRALQLLLLLLALGFCL
jgi:hypothetical protein